MAADPEAIVLAHLRRIIIGEMLRALPADQADAALSAAIKHLIQYADEGPVLTIQAVIPPERFRVIVDWVIDDLQARKIEAGAR